MATELHRRVRTLIAHAEKDPELHQALQDDPPATLARYGITVAEIDDLRGIDGADDGGCTDGTCWVSMCPDTCYVTVCTPSGFLQDPGLEIVDPAELERLGMPAPRLQD